MKQNWNFTPAHSGVGKTIWTGGIPEKICFYLTPLASDIVHKSASHPGLDYSNPGPPQYLFILNVYGIMAGLLLLYCKRGKLNMRGEMEVAG